MLLKFLTISNFELAYKFEFFKEKKNNKKNNIDFLLIKIYKTSLFPV